MKSVTLIQPWAWAICHAGKRVENRTWADRNAIGKPLAIHAGKTYDTGAVQFIFRTSGLPVPASVTFGAVVAVATLADVVHTENHLPDDQWAWYCGPFGWVLEDVQVLPEPVPCRGALSLWDLPPDVLVQVMRQIDPYVPNPCPYCRTDRNISGCFCEVSHAGHTGEEAER